MYRIGALVWRLRHACTRRGWGIGLLFAALAGCGSSTEVSELPEAAKKSLIQKKLDVPPRPSPNTPSRR
jgi:hypothetical protein